MRTAGEFVDPFVDVFEGIFVGQIEDVDDTHHTSVEKLAQWLVLLFPCSVPVHWNDFIQLFFNLVLISLTFIQSFYVIRSKKCEK